MASGEIPIGYAIVMTLVGLIILFVELVVDLGSFTARKFRRKEV